MPRPALNRRAAAPPRPPLAAPPLASGQRALALGASPETTAAWGDLMPAALTEGFFAREAESSAGRFYAASTEAVLRFDAVLRIVYANAACFDVLGLPRSALLGRRPVEIEAWVNDAALWHRHLLAALAGEHERSFEFVHQDQGRSRQFAVRLLLERDSRGQPQRLTAALQESGAAAPLRRASGSFAESGDAAHAAAFALRRALDLARDIMLEVDREGRIVGANESTAAWLGVERDELLGRPLATVDLSLTSQRLEEMGRAFAERGVYRGEGRFRVAGGAEVPVELVGQRVAQDEHEFTFLFVRDISGRKRAEGALADSVQRFRALFDQSPVATLFMDAHFRLMQANRAADDLFGCNASKLAGIELAGLLHPDSADEGVRMRDKVREQLAAEGRASVETELRLRARDGAAPWARATLRAWTAADGERQCLLALQDITLRKQHEAELALLKTESERMFDTTLAGLLFVRNGQAIRANRAAAQMLALPEDAQWDQTPPFEHDAERALLAELGRRETEIVQRGSCDFEMLVERRAGSPLWIAVQGRAINPERPAEGAIFALLNIDARRRADEELRRTRELLDLVFEHLPSLVAVREVPGGRFLSLNRAGETITGLAREQVIGRTWHEIYGRHFAELFAQLDRKAIADGLPIERGRDVLLRADGSTLTVRHTVVPIRETDARGQSEVRYVMSIISDWTEQARAESALRETEARFRQLAENIDELVFITDASLAQLQYINPRLEALVGLEPSAALAAPQRVLDFVHPQALPALRKRLPRLLAQLRRVRKAELELRVQHPIQGERVLDVKLTPVKLPDGTVRVFGMAEDITERLEAERARTAAAAAERDVLLRELHQRIKSNLQGVAGLVQKVAADNPESAETLLQTASQIEAIAQVHGLQLQALAALPAVSVVQGIVAALAERFGAEIRYEIPAPTLWSWGLAEQEAVPVALIVNELVLNALRHRADATQPVQVRVLARPGGLDLRIENSGSLPEDFDLARIGQGAQGLPLVRSLLPRRGARLSIEPTAGGVLTRLELVSPALVDSAT